MSLYLVNCVWALGRQGYDRRTTAATNSAAAADDDDDDDMSFANVDIALQLTMAVELAFGVLLLRARRLGIRCLTAFVTQS